MPKLIRFMLPVLLCLAFSGWAQSGYKKSSDDKKLPDYKRVQLQQFKTLQPFTLASLDQTKPTYIKFWASWCQPCMEQMPHFEKLYQDYGDKVNFVAVNININEKRQEISKVQRRFELTMPIYLDQQGQLALAMGLVGTPYSVLLNPKGEKLYSSHESDSVLDAFISRLALGQQLPAETTTSKLSDAAQQKLLAPYQTGEQLVFFTATWCDWYLAESRPEMAKECKDAQAGLNQLAALLPQKNWSGVVNLLWTDDKALAEFNSLYQMKVPFQIDSYGLLFQHFNVRTIPMLLKLKDGKKVAEISDFSKPDQVLKQLQ
ncbi:MAG: redoxin family protein [Gammaproteobacteria bacterium]|nr:redoxin family protein [Gammaproteobacteria bacterium]MBU2058007.1 redoxin family protein [Gammaproteobacteria bacterium]MBU2174359.1 redoxin family protein [Gammaproteobacteria bacterium]MBU2247577.1 redoxin family protein [Gammaproteobacteria bacterium]MBU2346082.1 redoxin family protein [Gammaproteobacteria bacterium]